VDEPALIRQAQKGDLQSFNALVLAHQSRAFNLAYRILGDSQAASDATQQAMISAFRGLARFRGGAFRSWLLRIVTNACYDELRRRKRRAEVSLEGMTEEEGGAEEVLHLPHGNDADNPETRSERAALAHVIQDCLDRLPMGFRVVAVLVDVQGFDYEESARILEMPVGTIKSRLARARARLRMCLQQHQELLPAAYRLKDEVLT